MKQYSNVFKQAMEHPKGKFYYEQAQARVQLAVKLHKERTKQKLTMAELAKKAQTTPAVISRIENAQVSAGIDIISRVFKSLGVRKLTLLTSPNA